LHHYCKRRHYQHHHQHRFRLRRIDTASVESMPPASTRYHLRRYFLLRGGMCAFFSFSPRRGEKVAEGRMKGKPRTRNARSAEAARQDVTVAQALRACLKSPHAPRCAFGRAAQGGAKELALDESEVDP
jgi:hypothetical protein